MRGFWVGWVFHMAITGFTQDLLGKDRYLDAVNAGWLNTPLWIWPVMCLFVIALDYLAEHKPEVRR